MVRTYRYSGCSHNKWPGSMGDSENSICYRRGDRVKTYRLHWYRERLSRWIANHLPRWIVYHALIRAWANATQGEFSHVDVTKVTADQMINRW